MHIKLRELLDMVVAELKNCNQQIEYYKWCEVDLPYHELDIPFLIAPLAQSFESNNDDTYRDLIRNLEKYPYFISFDDGRKYDYCNPCDLLLYFYTNDGGYYDIDYKNFYYTISFRVDDDVHLDWNTPIVSITKNIKVSEHRWSGSKTEYCKFEDDFYSKEKALAEEKEKKEKELKIKQLRKQIQESEEQLGKLLE